MQETAYYYPEPYWLAREGGWIKSLLLFFDQIAILLPDYMYGRHALADPTLASHSRIKVCSASSSPSGSSIRMPRSSSRTSSLPSSRRVLRRPAAPRLVRGTLDVTHGQQPAEDLARTVYQRLAERGLATSSEDGVSIPIIRPPKNLPCRARATRSNDRAPTRTRPANRSRTTSPCPRRSRISCS